MSKIYFEENQKFTQVWLWLVTGSTLLLVVGVAIAGLYIQLVQEKSFGNNPMSDTGLIVFSIGSLLFSVLLILFLRSFHLQTKVDRSGISYRFFPLIRNWKTIFREEILEWEIVKKFAFQYGIHYGINSKTLNVDGSRQLKIKLSSGRTLYLGTQVPDQLTDAMQKLFDRQPTI